MKFKVIFISVFSFLLMANLAQADTISFPYGTFYQRMPNADQPLPGFGNYYSALGRGIKSVLWNPAGLLNGPTLEASLILPSGGTIQVNKTYPINDTLIASSGAQVQTYVYFTKDTTISSPESRTILGNLNYKRDSGSLGYEYGIVVNNWLGFGIKSGTSSNLQLALSGDFSALVKMNANLYNFSQSGMAIDANGKLTYTHTLEGGSSYKYETPQALWSGFLSQEASVPTTAFTELLNNVNVNNEFIFTGAAKTGPLQFGVNIIPITANGVIDNTVKVITSNQARDQTLYSPNFDPNDEVSVAKWMMDQNNYGTSKGYKANIIRVPTGDIIGDGRYKGTYSGSTVRLDFGAIYAPSDVFSLGVNFENINSSILNLKGKGIVAIVTSKVSGEAMPTFDPVKGVDLSPISDSAQVVSGTENYSLESEKNFEIPKRFRIGLALKKPFLIALDYEIQQNGIKIQTNTANGPIISAVNDLKILRGGIESQFLMLPLWFRLGMGILFKPQVSGDPALQESINNLYKRYPALPMSLDLGWVTKIYEVEIGTAFDIEPVSSLLTIYQLDTINLNSGKTSFTTIYVKQGSWKFSYIANLDVFETAGNYQNSGQSFNDTMKNIKLSDLKFNSTYVITYTYRI